jgi:hypothetical protein
MSKPAIHLHCLYHRGPQALRGVTLAIALCGESGLAREHVTSFADETTCTECRKRATVLRVSVTGGWKDQMSERKVS